MTMNAASTPTLNPRIAGRADQLYGDHRTQVFARTDRLFAYLMLGEWAFGILLSLLVSPYAWAGKVHTVSVHVPAAVILGGLIVSLPVALAFLRPGWVVTRNVIAAGQMLMSGLLVHLTGGRIETHFQIFGSLAFITFYRDWRPLFTATVVTATDHLARQVLWPESIYGIANPEWWRFLEHAGWVVYIDVFLLISVIAAVREMREVAERRGAAEVLGEEATEKSTQLDQALGELKNSQETLVRVEKLAAVGQLAASVGHELRNPLSAVRNAHAYVSKKLEATQVAQQDPRVAQFMVVIDRELSTCNKIISDLLDFARERPPALGPCPLQPLVEEAMQLVPVRAGVKVFNDVPASLPVPTLDKEQFRQVLINLVQNATEAFPAERGGEVHVLAEGGGEQNFTIRVRDNGQGIEPAVQEKIFQPLFTTKTKGTGLGLAIVAGMVGRHGGTIRVQSEVGKGTEFIIELPATAVPRAA
ncbi:MAG: two-component sensor histidine kinase [Deltaproteobacteria bacterium]|nr:two-component sensor histidine kinase [Deltaproteobacteria bacterium]